MDAACLTGTLRFCEILNGTAEDGRLLMLPSGGKASREKGREVATSKNFYIQHRSRALETQSLI